MIDMNHKYRTRDGRAVEILRTNVKSVIGFPIIGIITEHDGSEEQDRWTADGHYYGNRESGRDLIPVPTKYEGWMQWGSVWPYELAIYQEGQGVTSIQDFLKQIPKGVHEIRLSWEG